MSGNTYYSDYLGLQQLLTAQHPRSTELGRPAHDELLFIITHQVYELWFKQILHELDSVMRTLQQPYVKDPELSTAVARLERVIEIQKLMILQLEIIETMTPLDFLEFRSLLVPASGFQSFQFRLIENRLGLPAGQRLKYHHNAYTHSLSEAHRAQVEASEAQPSLFAVMEKWLERIPFLKLGAFDFWQSYAQAVSRMFAQDRERVQLDEHLSQKEVDQRIAQIDATETSFLTLFNDEGYAELQAQGKRRLSYTATQAALLILLYRERPILQMPYRLLTSLITIDEQLNTWRYRHALMVQHMIGSKQGTGGSMGYEYLIKTLEAHRIFNDLTQLTTFLIPRSALPQLPPEIDSQLGFSYQGGASQFGGQV